MKEHEFRSWLITRCNPSTYRTYLSDMRRVERRFGELHELCLSGGIENILDRILKSGESGENKSYKSEMQAIRTYTRFLDDYLCNQPIDNTDVTPPEANIETINIPEKSQKDPSGTQRERRNALTYSGGFWHPDVFPREAFVQRNIQNHFLKLGFRQIGGGHADWVCKHPTSGQHWHIECKGLTTAVGLDFRTGLGQLLQAMRIDRTNYAIAVPNIPAFTRQIERMNSEFASHAGIQFLLVDSNGQVTKHA